jgi:hypothetical protein
MKKITLFNICRSYQLSKICLQPITTVFIIFILTGCTHYYYVPPTQNVPLFREKNEVRITANVSNDVGVGVDIQAAYAMTDKFAIMTSFSSVKDEYENDLGKGNYFDLALGYYKPLDKNIVFEIYGGFGSSTQNHKYSYYNDGSPGSEAHLSFVKLFLQPSFGYTSNGFDVAVTAGLSNVIFREINNRVYQGSVHYEGVNLLSQNKSSFLFEPSLTLRGGWKYAKVQAQILYSKNLSHPELNFFSYRSSLGLTFAFAERFKNKNRVKKTSTR